MPLYLGSDLINSVYIGVASTDVSTTAITITENGTYTPPIGSYYSGITVNVPSTSSSVVYNQNKTITPTTNSQLITADSGYTGLGTVTINPIPSEFVVPTGVLNISANGSYNVKNYATATVNISTGGVELNNQSKTATATESQQIISYDSGYTGLEQVTIAAISTTYVGSQVVRLGATTYNTSSSNQTIAANTYLTGAQTIRGVTVSGLNAADIRSGTVVSVGDSENASRITTVTGTLTINKYYTGSSAPSSSLGNNGDIYLQA